MNKTRQRVLLFVIAFMDRNCYAPSFREIARGARLNLSGAHYHVEQLEQAGYLKRGPRGLSRTLMVTAAGRRAVEVKVRA